MCDAITSMSYRDFIFYNNARVTLKGEIVKDPFTVRPVDSI